MDCCVCMLVKTKPFAKCCIFCFLCRGLLDEINDFIRRVGHNRIDGAKCSL